MSYLTRDRFVNIDQALRYSTVSRRTLYHWMRDGKLEWRSAAGGQRSRLVNLAQLPPKPEYQPMSRSEWEGGDYARPR